MPSQDVGTKRNRRDPSSIRAEWDNHCIGRTATLVIVVRLGGT